MQDKHERIADRLAAREKEYSNSQIIQGSQKRRRKVYAEKELERLEAKQEHELAIYREADREFSRSPLDEVPDEVKLDNLYFEDVANKVEYNGYYADYYMKRYTDTNVKKYADISERVRNCHKSWFGDHYKQSGYFNVKRVFHCHNRWCWLCNHLKQAKRLMEYHVKFDVLLKTYDLYHVVFTVKNITGDKLKDMLTKMQNSLKRIIRYFQGFGKIKGIDFEQYGFVGAIRSFEIVINPTDYHPHIHCLFMLDKDLNMPQTEINKFSFDKGVLVRKFSKLEILLQKMFYLLVNGQGIHDKKVRKKYKVNEENLQTLSLGYSCIIDRVEGDKWHEVFKYATKMSKEGASVCTYDQFVLLDDILRKFKMLQCYGIFYDDKKEKSDDDEPTDPTAEILFEKVLILLNSKEKPERDISIALDKLVDEVHNKKLTVISKRLSYKYMKTIIDNLRRDMGISADRFEPF